MPGVSILACTGNSAQRGRLHVVIHEWPCGYNDDWVLKMVTVGINLIDRFLPQPNGIDTEWLGREQAGIGHHHAAYLRQFSQNHCSVAPRR